MSAIDFYETPEWVTEALLDADQMFHAKHSVVEPCAGAGAIDRVLKRRGFQTELYELDPELAEKSGAKIQDARTLELVRGRHIITNPPFSQAEEIIAHIVGDLHPSRAAFLLRLGMLASKKRRAFWEKVGPCQLYVLSQRPSFTGSGTDSQEYAWFVWDAYKAKTGTWRVI